MLCSINGGTTKLKKTSASRTKPNASSGFFRSDMARMSNAQPRRRKGASIGPRCRVKNHLHRRHVADASFQLCPKRLFGFGRKISRVRPIARQFAESKQLLLHVSARNCIPKAIFVGQ